MLQHNAAASCLRSIALAELVAARFSGLSAHHSHYTASISFWLAVTASASTYRILTAATADDPCYTISSANHLHQFAFIHLPGSPHAVSSHFVCLCATAFGKRAMLDCAHEKDVAICCRVAGLYLMPVLQISGFMLCSCEQSVSSWQ